MNPKSNSHKPLSKEVLVGAIALFLDDIQERKRILEKTTNGVKREITTNNIKHQQALLDELEEYCEKHYPFWGFGK